MEHQWIGQEITGNPVMPHEMAPFRRADIQGIRALAVLLVVLFHARLPIPGGFIGVDVFFVISGFVITGLLHRRYLATGRIDFAAFYKRRLQRLTPALALMLAAILVLSVLLQSPLGAQRTTALTAMGAMLFTANFAIPALSGGYFAAPAEANPLLNTWSLSVEEQFYFIFPALLLLGWYLRKRFAKGPWVPIGIVLLLTITSFALMVITSRMSGFRGELLFGFYGPIGRAWEFGIGAALALLLATSQSRHPRMQSASSLAGIALIVLGAFTISSNQTFPDFVTLLPVLGTALLLFGGSGGQGPVTQVLSSKPFVKLGDLSYSWYLWHWPLIVFAMIIWPSNALVPVVAAAVSLLPAIASYHWVEQPIRLRPVFGKSFVIKLVGFTFIPVLALGTVLLIGSRTSWGLNWDSAQDPTRSASADRGCHDAPFDPSKCTWRVPNARGTILLVGDSQAHALSDGVLRAASDMNLNVIATSQNACPFTEPDRIQWNPRYEAEKTYCAEWQKAVLAYALKTHPSAVVIANRSPLYVNREFDYSTLLSTAGSPATNQSESIAYWRDMTQETLRQLRGVGIGVILVSEPPEGASADIQARQSLLIRHPSIPQRASRSQAEMLRARSMKAEAEAVAGTPGVVVVDPFATLCEALICPGDSQGLPLYSDGTHLSRQGSLAMSEPIKRAFEAAIG